ncbi:response regulator transcription factor [Sphingomonas montanisoli]|uniref:Response regulator transcription factor n=2 Tax=Sphingomonas montanisoli TaxID=2606412 RepID=A0A5D9C3G7_9SPHN|nr:response regulator transcription factor [Sphingomonas montanisoli]
MMTRCIYLVDDDEGFSASVAMVVKTRLDVEVVSFASGEAFIAKLAMLPSGCLLLDLALPGMNGLDVLREVRLLDGRFETIVLTGFGDISRAVEAMKAGASDFLEKPSSAETLTTAIETAFARIEDRERMERVARASREQIEKLTPRERDVLMGLVEGRANKVIAYQLDISPRTVEIYRAHLMEKLGVRSVAEAVRMAFASGLVPLMPEEKS